MHVCAMASARATIGGPLRSDLLARTSARAAAFQSLTTLADAEVAHKTGATNIVSLRVRRSDIGPSAATQELRFVAVYRAQIRINQRPSRHAECIPTDAIRPQN